MCNHYFYITFTLKFFFKTTVCLLQETTNSSEEVIRRQINHRLCNQLSIKLKHPPGLMVWKWYHLRVCWTQPANGQKETAGVSCGWQEHDHTQITWSSLSRPQHEAQNTTSFDSARTENLKKWREKDKYKELYIMKWRPLYIQHITIQHGASVKMQTHLKGRRRRGSDVSLRTDGRTTNEQQTDCFPAWIKKQPAVKSDWYLISICLTNTFLDLALLPLPFEASWFTCLDRLFVYFNISVHLKSFIILLLLTLFKDWKSTKTTDKVFSQDETSSAGLKWSY